jgi:head-tail adaptor
MVGVDPKMLVTMRAAVRCYMLDAVTIGTISTTHDRYGASTESFSASETLLAQLRQPRATETQLLDELRHQGALTTETLVVALPFGTSLTSATRIRTADDRLWRVVHVKPDPALAAHTECVITLETVKSS